MQIALLSSNCLRYGYIAEAKTLQMNEYFVNKGVDNMSPKSISEQKG